MDSLPYSPHFHSIVCKFAYPTGFAIHADIIVLHHRYRTQFFIYVSSYGKLFQAAVDLYEAIFRPVKCRLLTTIRCGEVDRFM
jgi:hypothetical protein